MPDHLKNNICAATFCRVLDLLGRIIVEVDWDGTQLLRLLESLRDRVDGIDSVDHCQCRSDGTQPNRSTAYSDHSELLAISVREILEEACGREIASGKDVCHQDQHLFRDVLGSSHKCRVGKRAADVFSLATIDCIGWCRVPEQYALRASRCLTAHAVIASSTSSVEWHDDLRQKYDQSLLFDHLHKAICIPCPQSRTLSRHLPSRQSRQQTHVLYGPLVSASSPAALLLVFSEARDHTTDEARRALQMPAIEMKITPTERCRSDSEDGIGRFANLGHRAVFNSNLGAKSFPRQYCVHNHHGCAESLLSESWVNIFSNCRLSKSSSLHRSLPRAAPDGFFAAFVNEISQKHKYDAAVRASYIEHAPPDCFVYTEKLRLFRHQALENRENRAYMLQCRRCIVTMWFRAEQASPLKPWCESKRTGHGHKTTDAMLPNLYSKMIRC
nr:hypothetical protein CFP56_70052 [Quercus suber]